MTPRERSKQLARIIHDHYCKDNLRALTETGIEQAIIAAEEATETRERTFFARRLREEADKIWAIGKRIEESGKCGDFALWHQIKQAASDLHGLARKLEAQSEGGQQQKGD